MQKVAIKVDTKSEPRYFKLGFFLLLVLPACGHALAMMEGEAGSDPLSEFLESRGLKPDRVIRPFALTEEMRGWIHERVPKRIPDRKKLEILSQVLLDPKHLDLEYSRSYTGTASEVFLEKKANCLAFTNLFVGMARELGVPVYFLSVRSKIYRKERDLVVLSNHIGVGYGTGPEIDMYDFSEEQTDEQRHIYRISDQTAVAMFYSNRGAEALQEDRIAEATGWLRTAVAIDPDLAMAWGNLGVGLRRLGDFEGAERAYKRAIGINPRMFSSYQNLSALMRMEGREAEAQKIDQLLRRSPTKNPYTYLALGDISLRSHRLSEARRFYRRAVHLSDGDPEPYAALGEVALATGDLKTARRMLKKARKLDLEHYRTLRLARRVLPHEN